MPADFTVEAQAKRFLAVEQARGKAAGTFGDLAAYVNKLKLESGVLTDSMDVRTISERTVTDLYSWLRNNAGLSATVQRKVWNYFRRFVRFLWAEKFIDLPRNLGERTFSFNVQAKKIKTYPVATVRAMVNGLPSRLKLYALLALNCGMYGVDIASLTWSEYSNGRITRKRTKTRAGENVPEVSYRLWPETVQLLEKWKGNHPQVRPYQQDGHASLARRDSERETFQGRSGSYPVEPEAR